MSNHDSYLARKSRTRPLRGALFLAAAFFATSVHQVIAAPAANQVGTLELTPQVVKLLEDADKALAGGNVPLALIQLKNAVRQAPANGEVHARLGTLLLRTGEPVAAEHELREARDKDAPDTTVVPFLLATMSQRKEYKELLTEFPNPPATTQDPLAADVLRYRALALQATNQPKEARAAIERSLQLRRDVTGLLSSAEIVRQQGDLVEAQTFADEALKLEPANELAHLLNVVFARQSGDLKKALAAVDEYVRRAPNSIMAKALRVDILLDAKDEARAKLDVDALAKLSPQLYGRYYRGVMLGRTKDFKGAWQLMQGLSPQFVQADLGRAMMVASIAAAAGNLESGGGILTTLLTRYPDIKEIRLQLAAIRLSQNSPRAAVEALTPVKETKDPTVHALLAQGYLALRQYNQAIESLQIASASPQSNELLKRQLALSELQVGDNDKALEGFRSLIQRDPKNLALSGPMVVALMRERKWDEALALVDIIAKETPKSPIPVFNRAQILTARGSLAEAQAALDKALALDPKFQPALYYRAIVFTARGNTEAAKKDLELSVAQSPSNIPAYMTLAQIALNEDKEQEGLSWVNRAIKAAPKDATPRLALANYQVSRGRYKEAQTALTSLLEVARDNTDAIALQGQIQLLQGSGADAVKTFRALTAIANVSPLAYGFLANALYATKDQLGAEGAAKRGIELAPDSIELCGTLIGIQIGGGKGAEALATARSFENANPGPLSDMLVASTLVKLTRTNEAQAVLEKSLNAQPDSRVALALSKVALGSGDIKKGSAVLSNWIAKNPSDAAMRKEYAAYQMSTGGSAGARKDYEALLKMYPEDPVILNNLGWLVQKDDPERALSMLTLANKIAPRSAEIADTLGWLKYQRKDHQGALQLLQRAHDIDGNSAPISYHLALALDATGKRAEAKSLLQATLANTPKFDGSEDAKQMLTRW